MIAYLPALTALLALSNVAHVTADGKDPFTFDLELTFDDSHASDLTDADKTIIEGCVVSSFNEVHDTSITELYSFDISKFEIIPNTASYLTELIPGALGGSGGGSYSYGGGSGGNCRACGNDDMLESTGLTFSHEKWQHALKKCLVGSGSEALAKAHNCIITVGDEKAFGQNTVKTQDLSKEPFTFDLEVTFDDPNAAELTDADKTIVEGCVVSSFNEVHDTSIIELYSFDITKFDIIPDSSYLSHLLPGGLGGSGGGSYSYGGGSGGNCRACGNDDMLESTNLAYSHSKWQTAFNKCIVASGSHALSKATNVIIKPAGESVAVAVHDPKKEDFTMNIAVTFSDPDIDGVTDADKQIISDCIVTSFNAVHDTEVIELYSFDMKKFEIIHGGVLSLLRGAPAPLNGSGGGSYSYGGGSGGNCRACGNDDMLTADMITYTHVKWQTAFNKCLTDSGSAVLAKASNAVIKIEGTDDATDMLA